MQFYDFVFLFLNFWVTNPMHILNVSVRIHWVYQFSSPSVVLVSLVTIVCLYPHILFSCQFGIFLFHVSHVLCMFCFPDSRYVFYCHFLRGLQSNRSIFLSLWIHLLISLNFKLIFSFRVTKCFILHASVMVFCIWISRVKCNNFTKSMYAYFSVVQ